LDRLWAPWRMQYILDHRKKGCVFCRMLPKNSNAPMLIKKTRFSFAALNAFPYNNGHLLVMPDRHIGDISRLTDEELLDMQKLMTSMIALLKKTLKPAGFNIGMNLGKTAGAGITDHLHWHIVPRFDGDTNFMPVTGSTKIISQSLCELRKLLIKNI
jgi:ATP adenylyltransferase